MKPPVNVSSATIALALLIYPLLVYWLWNAVPVFWLAVVPLCALIARAALSGRELRPAFWIGVSGAAAYGLTLIVLGEGAVLWYPTVVNVTLALTFGQSLLRPPSLIETLSIAVGMEVTPEGVVYTRWVTILWTTFFAINSVITATIAWHGSLSVWGLYNGVLSNVAAVVIFLAEFSFRQWYRRRVHQGPTDAA